MVESNASVPLNNNQLFANSYGSYSNNLTYVSKHGDIKPIFKAPFFGSILAILTSFFSYLGSNTGNLGTSIKKFLQILAIFFLVVAIGCFVSYIFIYFTKYLPEYRNWYATLPTEAVEQLKKMSITK